MLGFCCARLANLSLFTLKPQVILSPDNYPHYVCNPTMHSHINGFKGIQVILIETCKLIVCSDSRVWDHQRTWCTLIINIPVFSP